MRGRNVVIGAWLLCLLPWSVVMTAAANPVEVYRDDQVVIRAGVIDMEREIIHFGDVLSLAVSIDHDPEQVTLPEMATEYFGQIWPESQGIYPVETVTTRSRGDQGRETLTSVFRFQILACPDEEVLCRGTRYYQIPEFTLDYQVRGGGEPAQRTAVFRPWPVTVMLASAIPLGEEGELNPFSTYFPAGGYPDPLSGRHDQGPAAGLLAGSLILLLGGLLMSPFSFFKRGASTQKTRRRWEDVLRQLREGGYPDDEHTLDAIRKCLVWYCLDELEVDPFYWVKHQEELTGKKQQGTGEYEGYRKLFLDLLQAPKGQSGELLDRLGKLVNA